MNQSIWDKAAMFIVGLIARWSFKVLSGVLLALGVEQSQWELWVGALLSFIVGAIISKSQNNYLRDKQP